MAQDARWFRRNVDMMDSEWLAALPWASRAVWGEILAYVASQAVHGRCRAPIVKRFAGGRDIPVECVEECIAAAVADGALLIEDGQVKFKTTWKAEDNYYEVDWRDMEVDMDCLFIRVTGEATANEAADVIKAVSQLRQRHEAFVITNAVKVEGVSSDYATESIESLKAFDVVGAIMEELNEQEQECVKGLLNA
jgi:hypothetical protein